MDLRFLLNPVPSSSHLRPSANHACLPQASSPPPAHCPRPQVVESSGLDVLASTCCYQDPATMYPTPVSKTASLPPTSPRAEDMHVVPSSHVEMDLGGDDLEHSESPLVDKQLAHNLTPKPDTSEFVPAHQQPVADALSELPQPMDIDVLDPDPCDREEKSCTPPPAINSNATLIGADPAEKQSLEPPQSTDVVVLDPDPHGREERSCTPSLTADPNEALPDTGDVIPSAPEPPPSSADSGEFGLSDRTPEDPVPLVSDAEADDADYKVTPGRKASGSISVVKAIMSDDETQEVRPLKRRKTVTSRRKGSTSKAPELVRTSSRAAYSPKKPPPALRCVPSLLVDTDQRSTASSHSHTASSPEITTPTTGAPLRGKKPKHQRWYYTSRSPTPEPKPEVFAEAGWSRAMARALKESKRVK